MPGMTSRVAWKAELRLIARMASHFSAGNCSSGATNWMPALLTRMSTLPSAAPAPSDQAGDRSRPAHVGAVEADFASRFLGQAGADRLDLVGLAEAIQHDLGAGESQRPGEAEADAAGRAGDDGRAAFQGSRRRRCGLGLGPGHQHGEPPSGDNISGLLRVMRSCWVPASAAAAALGNADGISKRCLPVIGGSLRCWPPRRPRRSLPPNSRLGYLSPREA